MNSYKITRDIENDIETLHDKMLCTINYSKNTVTFNEVAENFLTSLHVEFSRAAKPLIRVGLELGIITTEQVEDYTARRAEYEKVLGDAYTAAKAAGKSEQEARAAGAAAWEARKAQPAIAGEVEEIETHEYNRETDELTTVTTYRVVVNGETDVHYFYDRADAELLLKRSVEAGKLI